MKVKSRVEMLKKMKMPVKSAAANAASDDASMLESNETPADEAAESPEVQQKEAAEGTEEHTNADLAEVSDEDLVAEVKRRGLGN